MALVKMEELKGWFTELSISLERSEGCFVVSLRIEPILMEQIKAAQQLDERLIELGKQRNQEIHVEFAVGIDGIFEVQGSDLCFKGSKLTI